MEFSLPLVFDINQMSDTEIILIQILNVFGLILNMGLNWLGGNYFENTDIVITNTWKLTVQPAGWAFSIWGVIYLSLISFVIYQALPSSWVPDRNNQLIFGGINYHFFINMMVGCVWRLFFQFSNWWGFTLAEVAMALMFVSCYEILIKSQ